MQVCVSSVVVPDHVHVTIGEDKTLEHTSAVTKMQLLTNLGNLFWCGCNLNVCLPF